MKTEEINRILSKDDVLSKVIPKLDLQLDKDQDGDIYGSLIRSITGQQLSVKAAATIHSRFLSLFPSAYPNIKELLSLDIVQLREKGLSRQKAQYIKNIATYFSTTDLKNNDWIKMDDDEIIHELTSIKGVGKWTVQMVLIFSMNRADIFPETDLGIQQGMAALYEIESSSKKELLLKMNQIADNWKPYRTYASRYIWAAKDLDLSKD